METLTQPRLVGIEKILQWNISMGNNSVLSYNDMVFLNIIKTVGLTVYSNHIQTMLNNIRERYLIRKSGYITTPTHQNNYDITHPLQIAVLCEHTQDFNTEILRKVQRIFNHKLTNKRSIIAADMFEFIQMSTLQMTSGYRLHGYIETPTAYLNKDYQEIKRVIQPAFVL